MANNTSEIQKLYIAYFNRPADSAGLAFWVAQMNAGVTLDTVQNSFSSSAEYQVIYTGHTNAQLIDLLYQNLFGRPADFDGLQYWLKEMTAAHTQPVQQTIQSIASILSSGTTPGSVDNIAINDKIAAATAFTAAIDTTPELLGYDTSTSTPNAFASASAWLANVKDAATLATALAGADAALAAAIAANASPTPGQTFALTIGTDVSGSNLIGSLGTLSTAGNDAFNATNLTLNSFDNINGGLGVNTFNYADTTAVAFALPPSLTLANLNIVNVSRVSTGTSTGAVAITDTTFGTGVTTLNYSEASASTAMTAATAAVTLNSATAVSVVSTGTGQFTTVGITDGSSAATTLTTATVTRSTGSITLTGNAITTVNLNDDTGATTVTSTAGTRALTVNTSGTVTHGGLTDTTATTLTIANSGAAVLGTFTAAAATTVNVSTTAAATGLVVTAPIATTLNISGTNTVAAVITGSVALTAINISGSAGLTSVVDLSGIATNLATITSTSTGTTTLGSSSTATEGFGTGVAFTGGAGNDIITVGATTKAINVGAGTNKVYMLSTTTALGTGGSITATTGSTDTLYMTNADAAALTTTPATGAAFKAAVTGFETFNVATAGNTALSMTDGGSFGTLAFTTAAVTQTVTGMTTGKTIEATSTGTGMTDVAINTLSAPADTMTIKLKGDLSAAAQPFGQFSPAGVEALTITTVDSNATHVDRLATITINDSAASSIILTGNNGVALSAASTAITTFDARGITKGGVTFTSGILPTDVNVHGSLLGGDTLDFSAATAIVTITETAGTNILLGSATIGSTITGGTGADTITGGAGIDTINAGAGANIVTGAAGADKITFGTHLAGTVDAILMAGTGETYSAATAATIVSGTTALTGIDVVTGMHAGDTASLVAILNTFTGAAATTIAGASGNTVALVRGDFAAATNIWTTSAGGASTLFVYDVDGAGGAGTVVEAVVLVGSVVTGTAAAGVLTLA